MAHLEAVGHSDGGPWHEPFPEEGLAVYQIQEQKRYELRLDPRPADPVRILFGTLELGFRSYGQVLVAPLEPGNYVGRSRVQVLSGERAVLDVQLEVRSRKLDYLRHYRQLLDALADWLASLVFRAEGPTAHAAAPDRSGILSPFLVYAVLRRMMRPDRLPAATQAIAYQPDRRLLRQERQQSFARARDISPRALEGMLARPQLLASTRRAELAPALHRALGGRLPLEICEQYCHIDYDTPANRFVKKALAAIGQRALQVEAAVKTSPLQPEVIKRVAGACRQWAQLLGRETRRGWMADVEDVAHWPATSTVLHRARGYREIRDSYDQLNRLLRVRWTGLEALLSVPNKNLARLYEYWCFLALSQEVSRCCATSPDWSSCLERRADAWELGLAKGTRARVKAGPWQIEYSPQFTRGRRGARRSYSIPFNPDYVVRSSRALWVFDAKYRLDDRLFGELTEPPARRFQPTDLYKMHTYRDALPAARAALILYPGNQFCLFDVRGEVYRDPATVPPDFKGVGAIPLLPGNTGFLQRFLERVLPA